MDRRAGSRFGPYEILAPLGAGAMGEVYRAIDTRLQREVALKILSKTDKPEDARRRLLQEARAAGALNHPNIVAVYDVGTEQDIDYIVTELVQGESLRAEIRRAGISVRKLLDLATQMADGLAAAHEAGIVHRDLKPENVMVTREGRVKILDFGVAKTVAAVNLPADVSTLTLPGLIVGTVPYMSPEQARGGIVDFRSDQFAFGSLVYELATGTPAFRRETAVDTLAAIVKDDPSSLATTNPRLPAPFRWIIERCLAKDPRARYASTADLFYDLRMLGERLAETASSDAVVPLRPGRWTGRWIARSSWIAAATVLLLLLITVRLAPTTPDLGEYRFTPLATDAAYEGFPAWSPDGRNVAYVAEVNGVLQVFVRSLDAPTPLAVTRAVKDCTQPFWSPDGNRIFYISQAGEVDSLLSVGAGGGKPEVFLSNVASADMSRDGKALVLLREETTQGAYVLSTYLSVPPGTEPTRHPSAPIAAIRAAAGFVRFAPDGTKIGLWVRRRLHQSRGEFWIMPFPTGEPRLVPGLSGVAMAAPFSWLPDSRHVVFGAEIPSATPGMHLWMADTERGSVQPITASDGNEYYPAVSPEGNRIVYSSDDTHHDIIEVPLDGSAVRSKLATTRDEVDPSWSPRSREFAYVTNRRGDHEIWITNQDVGREIPLVTSRHFGGGTFLLSAPTFSPDGNHVAFVRADEQGRFRVWVSPAAGGSPVQVVVNEEGVEGVEGYQDEPTWSPDGNSIAFTLSEPSGTWKLVRIRMGSRERPVTIKEKIIYPSDPQWSPTGEWITCELAEGFALVSPDGQETRMLSDETWIAHGWSKDGRRIFKVTISDDLRLALAAIDIVTGRETPLADLGPAPLATTPLQGFSLAQDGKSFLTSIVRLKGDLWLVEGFNRPSTFARRLWGSWWRP